MYDFMKNSPLHDVRRPMDWANDDGMKHGDTNLFLDTGHWGPFSYPVVLKNIQNSTITLSHHTKTGDLKYT